MTNFIINHLTKRVTRQQCGMVSAFLGMCVNLILCAIKFIAGFTSGSIAIISDAFNNLSDFSTALATIIGLKIVTKPADDEHPHGHERSEYVLHMGLSIMILLMGYELLKSSIEGIFKPSNIVFSQLTVIILIISIVMKIWITYFHHKMAKAIESEVLLTLSEDARNDVLATSLVLMGVLASQYTTLPIDNMMGIIVSLIILKSGIEAFRKSTSLLLGLRMNEKTMNQVKSIIEESDNIIGYHDLMFHDYGVHKKYGTCHIEFDSKFDFMEAHDIIDNIEKKIYEKTGVEFVIHMDPLVTDDERVEHYYQRVKQLIKEIHPENRIHDFRAVFEDKNAVFSFEVTVPYHFKMTDAEMLYELQQKLQNEPYTIQIMLKVENEY